jgi:hypothetical protein
LAIVGTPDQTIWHSMNHTFSAAGILNVDWS